MKLTFIGAAHEVTGSCTLLQVGNENYLIDCGMEQGKDIFENVALPVAAKDVNAVFLTHAHIDHSGMIPKLYKDGFKGTVYTTNATKDLCSIMLMDSAHIQEAEAEWKNRKAKRSGQPSVDVLYDTNDATGALKLFAGCNYLQEYTVSKSVKIRFNDVGHLLGSASIEVWINENNEERKIIFSGDVGNINHPIINDPKPVSGADYLVIESTYGNRYHEKQNNPLVNFSAILQKAFDRGGSVVIPSFAVGRTQELLYLIRQIKDEGLIKGHDGFPVYVDSPLAVEATNVFMKCDADYFDTEMKDYLKKGINPIWNDDIILSVTSDDSKLINFDARPKVILSASGMCEAGRIRHHLKHNLWIKNNIILFVGYQSIGSLGRQLLEGATKVKLFGEEISVNAEISSLQGTSGHADKQGLLNWINSMTDRPQKIFVNHGDEESCEDFKNCLINDYKFDAVAPYSGTEIDLLTGETVTETQGIRLKHKTFGSTENSRADILFNTLVSAANDLLLLCKSLKGHSNKEIAGLTDQIRSIINKYR